MQIWESKNGLWERYSLNSYNSENDPHPDSTLCFIFHYLLFLRERHPRCYLVFSRDEEVLFFYKIRKFLRQSDQRVKRVDRCEAIVNFINISVRLLGYNFLAMHPLNKDLQEESFFAITLDIRKNK